MTITSQPGSAAPGTDREQARKRIQARRDLFSHFISFLVVNAAFIGVWAVTGGGYFWPGWILACWGAGLVLHAWDVFWRRPITEADIDAELRRRD
jgi:2TM domain-containing protein